MRLLSWAWLITKPVRGHFLKKAVQLSFCRNVSDGPNVRFEIKEEVLELQHTNWSAPLPFHSLWLRDHCRCSQCYSQQTNQRLSSPKNYSNAVRPSNVVAQPLHLKVTWSDGHKSCYDYAWLRESTLEGQQQMHSTSDIRPVLWNADSLRSPALLEAQTPIAAEKLNQRQVLQELYKRILLYGFAFVNQVKPDMESTAQAAELVCRPTKTVFGERWQMTSGKIIHMDGGYTHMALRPHTDNTYFSHPVAINVFHCMVPAAEGGATILVDGFYAAQQLGKTHPESYHILKTTPTPAQYLEPGEHFSHAAPIFQHGALTNELEMIRWNLDDRGPLNTLRQSDMTQYYIALSQLTDLIEDPAHQARFQLQPGTLLFFDNWRLLHGRSEIRGRRVLSGVCFARDDFLSRARELGLVRR